MTRYRVVVLAGDGIGPEVTEQATRVLTSVADRFGWQVNSSQLIGAPPTGRGSALPRPRSTRRSTAMPCCWGGGRSSMDGFARSRPEAGLLVLRKRSGLEPSVGAAIAGHTSPLRVEVLHGVDVHRARAHRRLYYGEPGRCGKGNTPMTPVRSSAARRPRQQSAGWRPSTRPTC
jgi:3-isopropylmalate dehydrogenase